MSVQRIQISQQGPEISQLVAGLWRLKHWGMDAQALLRFIEQNLELGVTTMDHAMVYRSEAPFGEALALKPQLRSRMEIVSKCGIRPAGFGALGAQQVNHYDSSARAIIESTEASLKALRTDYIDILLIHRPDFLMRGEEMAEAFRQLRQQGKVRYFGVSNFSAAQFALLREYWPELVTNQVEMSPYNMQALESGVLEQCAMAGARPMLWSCLAGGKLMQPDDDKGRRIHAALQQVAREIGAESADQVVYAWALSLPSGPIPLLGSQRIERIRAAVAACQWRLNREQWYRIWEASTGSPVP